MGEWLVEFKGRNESGATQQNFLWRHSNIYVMDNHRAALWCWLQEMDKDGRYDLLHIDEQTDTLSSRLEEWKARLPDLRAIGIDEYLALECGGDSAGYPLIRWDNYLPLFLDGFAENVRTAYFATRRGDKPRWENSREPDFWDIPEDLENWLVDSTKEWIINVDLDFFIAISGAVGNECTLLSTRELLSLQ